MSDNNIKIVVGTEDVATFFVDQAVLEAQSAWFRAALDPNSAFHEAVAKTVTLTDYEPISFQPCKAWMEHGVYKLDADCTWKELAMTWLLADQLRLVDFGNEILKDIVNRHWQGITERERNQDPGNWAAGVSNVSPSTMHYIYDNSMPNSPLRNLFLYLFMDSRAICPNVVDLDDYPEAFASTAKWCFKHGSWSDRPSIRNFHDVDMLCGTALSKGAPAIIQYASRCTGDACRQKIGDAAASYITGPVYLCRDCPEVKLCSVCKPELTCKTDVGAGRKSHDCIEHWPAVFIQYRTTCKNTACRKVSRCVNRNFGYIIGARENVRLAVNKKKWRFHCLRCGQTFCHECGTDPECKVVEQYSCPAGNDSSMLHQLEQISGAPLPLCDELGVKEYTKRVEKNLCVICGGNEHNEGICETIVVPDHPPRHD
jgi:hypothetical protein